MKKLIFTILFASALSAHALPPQVEADRLLLQAKSALDAKDYAQARESLSKVEKLGVKLPDTFYYHYGRALASTGDFERAQSMLDKYLTLSGTKGKFYKEALVEMNNVEAAIKKRDADKLADINKREAERDADRVKYNKELTEYRENIQKCPELFATRVNNARERLDKAERECTNQWGNFCDQYEEKYGSPSTYGAGLERQKAKENLEEYERTSSDAWCSGRYSEPAIPKSLR